MIPIKITSETNRENTKLFFLNKDNKKLITDSLYQYKKDNNLEFAIIYKQTILFEAKKNCYLDAQQLFLDVQLLFEKEFECVLANYSIYNNEFKKLKIKINRLDY